MKTADLDLRLRHLTPAVVKSNSFYKQEHIKRILSLDIEMHIAMPFVLMFEQFKLFSLRPIDALPLLNLNNSIIDFVESHKHLGITFSCNGQWHTHIETIQKGAYKILGIMRKLKYSFSRQALNQMYVSYVRSLLEYSLIVWDGCTEQDKTALEKR